MTRDEKDKGSGMKSTNDNIWRQMYLIFDKSFDQISTRPVGTHFPENKF